MNDRQCIVATNITKSFGGITALSECTVMVPSGQVTGFIGSNGAGKSTLMNILAGVYSPTAGVVSLDGRTITNTKMEELVSRGLVKTFQTPRIFGSLTVLENLLVAGRRKTDHSLIAAIMGRRHSQDEQMIRQKALDILESVGMKKLSEAPAAELSGGQAKLLELGRALMLDPRALMLDEPLAGVAPSLHGLISDVVSQLAERGFAIGVVEHHISFINRTCHIAYALAHGKVIASGEVEKVLNHPDVVESLLQ